MKPFDLELAKQGKPVCTRDGRPARIVCFDVKISDYPILALVEDGEVEIIHSTVKGEFIDTCAPSKYDLMMVGEKHTGWVNIYKDVGVCTGLGVWGNEREAREHGCISPKYLATVKVEWED